MNKQHLSGISEYITIRDNNISHDTWAENFWWRFSYSKLYYFLRVRKTNELKNRTCRSCLKKIYDDEQLITVEPYNPTYHINCYMELFDILQTLIKKGLQETINDVEKKNND